MDERVIVEADLEGVLEARLRLSDDLAEVRKVYEAKNDEARGLIEALGLRDGEVVRVGRFRIDKSYVEPREVAFTSKARSAIRISVESD
jgi:hypothetical protein